ncbi:MAG: hypothetical protein MR450_11830 [Prevotella sp.]|nr:hypothetical protein [Prevotella sp.]MDY4038863.1 hypothetical protein [Prevotella sp.]
MKKRTYISPETVRLEMEAVAQVMAGSQSPYAEGKQNSLFGDDDVDWQDDNPWETVVRPKDLWE